MTGRRAGATGARLSTAALSALVLLAGPAAGPAAGQQPPDDPAPRWRLADLEGREVAFEDLVGAPVVLNFWATWCAPCVAELRSLEALARSLAGEDVRFVVVSPQERGAVADWVARRGYALPFYVEATRIPAAFGLEAVPTTWLLDRDGRVVLHHRGAADWDRDEVRALLRRLAGR